MSTALVECGDSLALLRAYPDNFLDACVTDPPYGIGFMGREWDTFKPGVEAKRIVANRAADSDNPNLKGRSRGPASSPSAVEYDRSLGGQRAFQDWTAQWATEVLRVLKPGAHLVVFGAPRSHHRMISGLEDAGFEIRDCLAWLFSQGFPKSKDVAFEMHKHAEQAAEHDLRFVLDSHLSQAVYACQECGQVLLYCMSEPGISARWRNAPGCGPEGAAQLRVERWRNLETPEGQLSRCPVCTMSHGILADGAGRRLHSGTPAGDGTAVRTIASTPRSRASHRSQPGEQSPGELDAVQLERRAQEIRGYGSALKPGFEPIALARKPFKGTLTANVEQRGTGALNIDGCRIEHDASVNLHAVHRSQTAQDGHTVTLNIPGHTQAMYDAAGRWPANVILDPEAGALLDAQTGQPVSRFFLTSTYTDTEWLIHVLGLANTAASHFDLHDPAVASALAVAVNAALPEGMHLRPDWEAPSIHATPTELRRLGAAVITTIQNIASRFWHESQPTSITLAPCPVKCVVQRRPTGITTITASHWKSDGSAADATFDIMPINSGRGGKDSNARFNYCPKTSRSERDFGCDSLPAYSAGEMTGGRAEGSAGLDNPRAGAGRTSGARNAHPTVKPIALMRWLVRLVTPPNGIVLDPFTGSGTTGIAATLEGFDFIGMEQSEEWARVAETRIAAWAEREEAA